MLTIRVYRPDLFNDETNEFIIDEVGVDVTFEHSLVSLSKWESKHEKPFLGSDDKTPEEVLDYIRVMVLDPNLPPEILEWLKEEDVMEIQSYINAKQTATWFNEMSRETRRSSEIITAELVYYWLDEFHINWETQHWHLNRLFTLIRIHSVKQEKPKKMPKNAAAARARMINERNRAKYNTTG